MSVKRDIENAAKRVNDTIWAVQCDIEGFNKAEIKEIEKWWKGNASSAFLEEYSEADSVSKKMITDMQNTEKSLGKLARAVQREEDEKEKKRLEAKMSK